MTGTRPGLRDCLQRYVWQEQLSPGKRRGGIGVTGWIDETSVAKKGEKTPGVQRQYCGASGKIENCVVTVHLGVGCGNFSCLLDSDLYVPESWLADKQRCKEAGIPADHPFAPKWFLAIQQVRRAQAQGIHFDWMGFDEGYGNKPMFLLALAEMGIRFVGEVPRTFCCFAVGSGGKREAEQLFPVVAGGKGGRRPIGKKAIKSARFILRHKTIADSSWWVKARRVQVSLAGKRHEEPYWLIQAHNGVTGETKYFISNAPASLSLRRMLEAAFSRWGIEHAFRVAKSEIGLGHYEGRRYRGLMRHMILCQLALVFVAEQTERLRGEKPAGDQGAGGAGAEHDLPALVGASARRERDGLCG